MVNYACSARWRSGNAAVCKTAMRGFDSRSGLIMKKSTQILLVLSALYMVLSTGVQAQEFDFDRAYQDYQFSLTAYDQAYTGFGAARDFYLKNPTLTLKEDARKKTLAMLKSRDQLYIVYLTALRMKIVEVKGLTSDEKGAMFTKIDNEVAWYKSHAENYKDGDFLEDLFNKSSESESRYKTNTSPIIYEALFTISLGEQVGLRQDHEAVYSELRAGVTNPDPYSRWFNDIENIVKVLKENEEAAKTQLQKMYSQNYSPVSSYNSAIATLTTSLKPLSQINEFLIEVATAIKNQQ